MDTASSLLREARKLLRAGPQNTKTEWLDARITLFLKHEAKRVKSVISANRESEFLTELLDESPGGFSTRRVMRVKVTHIPTGLSATSCEAGGDHRNHQLALETLLKQLGKS